jgi:hypothetical protein
MVERAVQRAFLATMKGRLVVLWGAIFGILLAFAIIPETDTM